MTDAAPASNARGAELAERVRYEALDRMYKMMGGNGHLLIVLVPLAVVVVMWSEVDHLVLAVWMILFATAIGVQQLIVRAYLRRPTSSRHEKAWGHGMTATVASYSLLWSAALWLFQVPGSVPHQVFMFTLAVVLSTGAISRALYWLPAAYAYSLPIQATLVLRLVLEGGTAYWVLAFLLSWAAAFVIGISRTLNRTMRSEMLLRHRSTDLARDLRVKTADAERAVLTKSRFLAAASHDLRQPIHALTLFVDALGKASEKAERARILSRIDHSLSAMKQLFDGLLDISRLDANVVVPEHRNFDICILLGNLAEEFRPVAQEKGLRLRVHTRPTVINTDPALLERVIRNLLANAIRYTNAGGVLLATRERDDAIVLQVWDTGVGIPDEHRDEVFQEFVQLHNAHRDRTEGLGLGLAMVQRLCELLEVPIELHSRPWRGSVFSLRLERGSQVQGEERPAKPPRRWDLSGRRVLVIDDEHDILDATQTLLSKWGLVVATAQTEAMAVGEIERQRAVPELMLVDLRLVDATSGIDAMNAIRARYGADIPGILITGDTATGQIALAQSSGYAVLHKPVRPARLRAMVQQCLSLPDSPVS